MLATRPRWPQQQRGPHRSVEQRGDHQPTNTVSTSARETAVKTTSKPISIFSQSMFSVADRLAGHQQRGQPHGGHQRRHQDRIGQHRQHHFAQPDVDRERAEDGADHGQRPGAQHAAPAAAPGTARSSARCRRCRRPAARPAPRPAPARSWPALCRGTARRPEMGAAIRASRQSLGSSRAKLRFSISVPAKAKTIHSRPPEISRIVSCDGIEGEAEQQQDHQREGERGVDGLLGAKLGAQVLDGD